MQNLMDEYIKIVNSNMNQFMKMCIDNKYIKSICDEFVDIYTEIRYYGLSEVKKGFTVKNNILSELRKKREELLEEYQYDDKKKKATELIYIFFDSCVALNEKEENELAEEIGLIIKLRKQHLKIEYDKQYEDSLYRLVKECSNRKKEKLDSVDTEEFYLRYSSFKTSNLKNVELGYNIGFPSIYSNSAITKAFNSGVVLEDKMFVEYHLITAQIIKDVESANYRKQYVIEFPETILDKPQKLLRLLEIINHPSIQDRAMLKISFNSLITQKDKIYTLLRNGYKIALNLDETFEANPANIQRLGMFQYILVEDNKNYLLELKKKLKNIIEV